MLHPPSRPLIFSREPGEEIDLPDQGREKLYPEGSPQLYTLEEVPGWRAGRFLKEVGERGEQFGASPPLVMRRELYRGLDENSYRHHDFWALYFVRRGHGTHVINGHAWSMVRGNVYLLAPDSVHFYRRVSDVLIDAIYFGESLFSLEEQRALGELSGVAPLIASFTRQESNVADGEQERHTVRLGHFLHLSPQRQIEVEATVDQMRHELARPERALHLSAQARLWCLIVQLALWRGENPNPTRGGESRELADILHFCETHFTHALTVEQLAAMTHFSRNHFTRLFTLEVGVAPATYVRHLRLQHAQKLLRETPHAAHDIARLCGFSDATAFSRAFQRSFGLSPVAYRKANRRVPKSRRGKFGSVDNAW